MYIERAIKLIRRVGCIAAVLAAAGTWSAGANAANLVQNPGFEDDAGKFAACGATLPNGGISGCDLTAWIPNGDAGEDIANPNSGSVDGFFGTGSLSQSLSTVAGATYSISFVLAADTGTLLDALLGSDATVDVKFGADDLTSPPISATNDFLLAGAAADQYFKFTFTDMASAVNTTLMFAGSSNDTWYLDDVSVACTANCGGSTAPVPEPSGLPLLLTALVAWPVLARLRRQSARA